MVITAALIAGLLSVMPPSGSADLSVELDAHNTLVLVGARYDVTITNNGPDALESATVVVRFEDTPFPSGAPTSCTTDRPARTLTCVFGSLAVGGSATVSATVFYSYGGPRRPIHATATRTASAPADLNQANDADTATCYYDGAQGIPSTGRPDLLC